MCMNDAYHSLPKVGHVVFRFQIKLFSSIYSSILARFATQKEFLLCSSSFFPHLPKCRLARLGPCQRCLLHLNVVRGNLFIGSSLVHNRGKLFVMLTFDSKLVALIIPFQHWCMERTIEYSGWNVVSFMQQTNLGFVYYSSN